MSFFPVLDVVSSRQAAKSPLRRGLKKKSILKMSSLIEGSQLGALGRIQEVRKGKTTPLCERIVAPSEKRIHVFL